MRSDPYLPNLCRCRRYVGREPVDQRQRVRLEPQDVFICNDPYLAGGVHLPDVYIIKPIFAGDRLAGWATTLAHHSDVGGIVAGSNSLGAVEIYQEGLRLPIIKVVSGGVPMQSVWDLIAANVRTPDLVAGDLQAQIAACTTGEREFLDLISRYGLETVQAYGEHLHNYAEHLMRAEIEDMPDGVYRYSDMIDGLGEDPVPIGFHVTLTIAGDRVVADWTGTSDQVPAGINSPMPFTCSCTFAALRSVMPADFPNCEGYTRPIEVIAPLGSLVNPRQPGGRLRRSVRTRSRGCPQRRDRRQGHYRVCSENLWRRGDRR